MGESTYHTQVAGLHAGLKGVESSITSAPVFLSPVQGFGVGGSNATCVELGPKQGGLTLACREGYQSGYQPFARGDTIEFWLKDMNGSSTIPNLQVTFSQGLCVKGVLCGHGRHAGMRQSPT